MIDFHMVLSTDAVTAVISLVGVFIVLWALSRNHYE